MRKIRLFVIASALVLFGSFTIQDDPSAIVTPVSAFAADPPPKVPDIDVNIGGGERTEKTVVWYFNPLVLAVGVAGIALLVALFAMVGRGGGTTIIREK